MSASARPNGGRYDDLVIGTGMAGLTVGALLANAGRRVLMLEAHDSPGGYAHTFAMGDYRFCAQVHYIFNCGEGEPIHTLLSRLGLDGEVTFHRLDPEGFDQIVVAGERFRIPNGLSKFRDRLVRRFPEAERPLRRYFAALLAAREESARLPDQATWRDYASAPVRFPTLLKYRSWTLQRLYDHVQMPQRLQAILAGQSGDYLLPPEKVSVLLHAALVDGYDRGAYYPHRHFGHFVRALVDSVRGWPGCDVLLEHDVADIDVVGGRVVSVRTRAGQTFQAERYISNVDPNVTMRMAGVANLPRGYRSKLDYEYSGSSFTLYLGLKDIDLREHGFGSHNVWHYPHDDINRMYRDQVDDDELSNPWMFLATPSLHSDAPGLAPPGHQVLEVATSCRYDYFADLRRQDERLYVKEKLRVRDRLLDILEERYIPKLREHLDMRVAGTPLTNEHFCRAPRGNAYGSALTPANLWPRIDHETPIPNLFLVNATAGFPSVGGTVAAGLRLFERLSSDG